MDLNSPQTKYVISLDAIDLNYIPTMNRYKGKEVTTIWTRENLNKRNNEYFEFEIKENDLDFKDDDCTNTQYTYITCHVCNVDVPKPFLKQHYNSMKHKTFKKIIDVSLERLTRIIKQEVFEDSSTSDPVYFCTSCITVVKNEQKISHEKSLAHKNSFMVEKFLNDFLDLYEDREESDQRCALIERNCNKFDYDNSHIQCNNKVLLNIDQVSTVNYATDKIKFGSTTDSNNKAVKIESITNEFIATPTVHDSEKNLASYIEFLIHNKNLNNIKVLQNNNLEIETKSGAKINIIECKFNGLKKQSKKKTHCILCSTTFCNNMKWQHLYEEKHLNLLTIPFENENCMRQINNTWSHCALCNTVVYNHEEHVGTNKDHKLRLDQALQVNTDTVVKCPDKDVPTASTSKQYSKEAEGNNTTKYKKVEQNLNIFNDDLLEKALQLELLDLSNNINNDYICKVCKTLICSNDSKVEEHMNSTHHIENYTKLMLLNNMTKSTEDTFYCTACKSTVTKYLTYTHISEKQHQQNLAAAVETVLLKIEGNFIKDDAFNCAICSKGVPNHNFNIYTHLESASHINSATKLPSDSVIGMHYHIDLTNFPTITCMVCNVNLMLYEKNINTHVNGYIHRLKYTKILEDNKIVKDCNGYVCTLCSVSISSTNELIHCQTKKHILKLENEVNSSMRKCDDSGTGTSQMNTPEMDASETDTPETDILAEIEAKTYLLRNFGDHNHLFCIVCNTKIPNHSNNIREHLNGWKHLQLYNKTLEDNFIVNYCDDFKCELCDVVIATGKELIHISTKCHEDNIKNAVKYKCVVCQVMLTKNEENIRLHDNGEQHMKMVELAASNNITIKKDKCFCGTCEKYISNESIDTHLNTEYHVMLNFSNGNC